MKRSTGRDTDNTTDRGELARAVARAKEGDEEAFTAVYRLVHPGLLSYVRGLVGGDEAEDVTSEAWLHIVRDLTHFHGDGAGFRAWTATVARNRALDHLRRIRSRPRPAVLDEDTLELHAARDPARDTESEALESLATRRTLALIGELPKDQREAVLLRVVVGLDGPAAARALGKRPGAVRSAAHRGLRRLARMLGIHRTIHRTAGGPDNRTSRTSRPRPLCGEQARC
ncbi:RNA polymerase sigma factor [Streptomyces sp. NPDC059009]|uniref:RNA polymerase sigma factor n=1 Tax=Streptomyces sp. NPDC059009 TaxID=3346694 RepID=UPI00367EE68C